MASSLKRTTSKRATLPPPWLHVRDMGVWAIQVQASNTKLFEIVIVDKNSACCYGNVGTGSAFCLKEGCEVNKAHDERKIFAKHDKMSRCVSIRQNSDTLFCYPLLDWKRAFETVISSWKGEKLSLKEWSKRFLVVQNTDDTVASFSEQVTQVEVFFDKAEKCRTPAKRKPATADTGPFGI